MKQQGKKISVVHTPHGDVEIRLDSRDMTYFFKIGNDILSHTDGVKIVAMAKEEMEKLNASVQWTPFIKVRIDRQDNSLRISRSRCAKFEEGWREGTSSSWDLKPKEWTRNSYPMGKVGNNPTKPSKTISFGVITLILPYSDKLWEALNDYNNTLLSLGRVVMNTTEKMIETGSFDPAPINKINAHLRELAPDPKENEEDE